MLLAIDCGNTNTVFSIWDGTRFLATWRIATDHRRTADEYFVWLTSLMTLAGTKATITEAIISSTVPRVVFNLRVLCDRYFGCRPLVVGRPDCRLPVAHYAVGSAVNQATRQIGSVLGVALTVALLGHAALQRADFNALYLLHGALALLTGLLCLPVDTRPPAAQR